MFYKFYKDNFLQYSNEKMIKLSIYKPDLEVFI